uniref:Protein BUD31 homolog n=1 Tax=Calidris pygmaea TaxID=425635 RepID=A0A8C3JJD6_9CHAR
MPKVKRSRKPPPDGWELIEPTLDELDQKMREAETEPHEGKRKVESLWPIFRIHHQKTRYIFDLFYKRKAISRELYEYCIKEGYADKNLIAKWKKQGYENLCCLRCIQTRDTNFGTNCICRVPKSKLEVVRRFQLVPPLVWTFAVPALAPPRSGTAEEVVVVFFLVISASSNIFCLLLAELIPSWFQSYCQVWHVAVSSC